MILSLYVTTVNPGESYNEIRIAPDILSAMIGGQSMAVNVKIKIPVNGIMQKIHVISKNEALPVLLFLHGGPGIVNRHSIVTHDKDLLDTFTIATWDQRGTGGSCSGVDYNALTIDLLVEDARAVVEYLCEKFLQPLRPFQGYHLLPK